MDRRISEISDDMAGIDGIGDCDEKSFSPSGRCSDICTSAKAETALTAIVDLLTIVFLCIMTYFGFKVVQSTTAQTSPAMQIPMALIYAAFPTGGVLMIMEQLLTFIERLKNKNAPEEPREFID